MPDSIAKHSLRGLVLIFCLPATEQPRALAELREEAQLGGDLRLSFAQRGELCRFLEECISKEVEVPSYLWVNERTTLGQLFDELERQAAKAGVVVWRRGTDEEDSAPLREIAASNRRANLQPVALLFGGQGAQRVGMCAELCEQSASARARFAEAAEVLGYDLLNVCLHGPSSKLNDTLVAQPAMLVANIVALERVPDTKRRLCVACAGLSLGEYAALVFANAMTFRDALSVVQVRAQAMQAAAQAADTG